MITSNSPHLRAALAALGALADARTAETPDAARRRRAAAADLCDGMLRRLNGGAGDLTAADVVDALDAVVRDRVAGYEDARRAALNAVDAVWPTDPAPAPEGDAQDGPVDVETVPPAEITAGKVRTFAVTRILSIADPEEGQTP